jgi:pimeloyl-ACP methyl ester carboxylesterase
MSPDPRGQLVIVLRARPVAVEEVTTTMKDNLHHRTVDWSGGQIHVVESGDPAGPPVLLLHGWPQSAHAWRRVMRLAREHRVLAFDLPGIGASTGAVANGTKSELAAAVHEIVVALDLPAPTLVGHDIGGMVVFAYLRTHGADLSRAVIMDTVIPGVAPWDQVRANPYIWHFAFHTIAELPERLVHGRQRPYFDYFYDILSPDPTTITDAARTAYAGAYRSAEALTAGFDWYRSFGQDAADNADSSTTDTPVRYLRGDQEGGDIEAYAAGLRAGGLTNVTTTVVTGAGHFTPEDAPDQVWAAIADDPPSTP